MAITAHASPGAGYMNAANECTGLVCTVAIHGNNNTRIRCLHPKLVLCPRPVVVLTPNLSA